MDCGYGRKKKEEEEEIMGTGECFKRWRNSRANRHRTRELQRTT